VAERERFVSVQRYVPLPADSPERGELTRWWFPPTFAPRSDSPIHSAESCTLGRTHWMHDLILGAQHSPDRSRRDCPARSAAQMPDRVHSTRTDNRDYPPPSPAPDSPGLNSNRIGPRLAALSSRAYPSHPPGAKTATGSRRTLLFSAGSAVSTIR